MGDQLFILNVSIHVTWPPLTVGREDLSEAVAVRERAIRAVGCAMRDAITRLLDDSPRPARDASWLSEITGTVKIDEGGVVSV